MNKRAKAIMGVDAPGPKPTATAIWLAVRYLGLPLIGLLAALDVIVWLVAEVLWGVCIGFWCWF